MTGIVPDELIQNLLPFFSTSMPFIASYNLAASAASVTFSNIPATFTHLQLWTLLRTDLAAEVDTSLIRFNGDAGNNYQRRYTYFRTLYGSTANRAASAIIGPYAEGNTATASRFTPGMTLIPFYRAPCFKGVLSWSINAGNISADDDLMMVIAGGHWDSAAVVNSITLLPLGGANWLTGCQFILCGGGVMGIEAVLAVQSHLVCLAATLNCEWTLLAGQLMRESSGDPNAIGDGGLAYGLCQIHLPTAYAHADLQQTPPARFLEPGVNMLAYILEMSRLWHWLGRYGISDTRLLLASWNWGCGNMKKHLDAGGGYENLPQKIREYVEDCIELGERFEEKESVE